MSLEKRIPQLVADMKWTTARIKDYNNGKIHLDKWGVDDLIMLRKNLLQEYYGVCYGENVVQVDFS